MSDPGRFGGTAPTTWESDITARRVSPAGARAPAWPDEGIPLVGRADERACLGRWLDEGVDGTPRVILVTGDAGVGKSRLLDHLDRDAATRGVRVLAGRCHQHDVVPYLGIAEAMRPLAGGGALVGPSDASLVDGLFRASLDAGVADDDGPRHQTMLYLAAARLLRDSVVAGPTLLSIEDIQWADAATVGLLGRVVETVAREAALSALPLVVALSVRSGSGRPVDTWLSEVRRATYIRELAVGPLGDPDLDDLIEAVAGARPDGVVRARLVELSEGNPLLVRLLVERMHAAGALEVRGAELVAVGPLDGLRIPHTVDADLAQRIGEVTDAARGVLTLAAFLGDGGDVAMLLGLADKAGLDGEAGLVEAERARLLVRVDPRYRFPHPLVRQFLYTAPSEADRRRTHRLVADHLGADGGAPAPDLPTGQDRSTSRDRAMAIDRHLRLAGAELDEPDVLPYARAAGDQAFALAAWSDAAQCYARAASAAVGRLEARDRAHLHLRAASAYLYDSDADPSAEQARAAIPLAREAGDDDLWARGVDVLLWATSTLGPTAASVSTDVAEADAFLDGASPGSAEARARVLARLSSVRFGRGDFDRAERDATAALDLVAGGRAPVVQRAAALGLGLAHLAAFRMPEARAAFVEARERAGVAGDDWYVATPENRLALVDLIDGDVDAALHRTARVRDLMARWQGWAEDAFAAACRTTAFTASGHLVEAVAESESGGRLARRSRYGWAVDIVFPAAARVRSLVGDHGGAVRCLDEWDNLGGRGIGRYRALVDVSAGDIEAARQRVARRRGRGPVGPLTLVTAPAVVADVELGAALGDHDLVEGGLDALERLVELGVVMLPGWGSLVPRVVAEGHAALRRGEESTRWHKEAEATARHHGLAAEAALVLRSAEPGSTEHTDGLRRLDDLGMIGALERSTTTAAGRIRVVLVTDLVDSTAINARIGDARYVEVMARHDGLVRDLLTEHGGVEFKHTGDGVCAWFTAASHALACALEISAAVGDILADGDPLILRCGVAAGEPIQRGEDLFGLTVSTAARVCAVADPGRVVVADEVRRLSTAAGHRFEPLGDVDLKGLPDPIPLHAVVATVGP